MKRVEDMFFKEYKEYKELVAIEVMENRNKILNLRKKVNGDIEFDYKRNCLDFIEEDKLEDLVCLYKLSHRYTVRRDEKKIDDFCEADKSVMKNLRRKYEDYIEDDIRDELEHTLEQEPEEDI